ncbi:MAG: redox-sensing transcriptional repressor Rex [Chloroflexota bacterium]
MVESVKKSEISDSAIARLPLYLRALNHFNELGRDTITSHNLGQYLGIGPAQIRKDLSHFGRSGKQGTGYPILPLIHQLNHVLHINSEWRVAVIGTGDLGTALANYDGFEHRGFRICWLFDTDTDRIGQQVGGLTVRRMDILEKILCQNQVKIAMIAVPAPHAQQVADRVVACGIKAILNYAPISLQVPEHVKVQYIDPIIHLQSMTYYLSHEKATALEVAT